MSRDIGASCAEVAQTGTIVGPQFCAPHSIHLVFTTKAPWLKDNHVVVTDSHGKFILWSGDRPTWSLGRKRILYDAHNRPLMSMQEMTLTAHKRWKVFIGDSSEDSDLLFGFKKSSMFQTKSKFDVFLASNKEEEACDFKIRGSYRKRTCTVYKGDSQMALAQMSKPQGGDSFGVHINPNTDYCFIAALFVILYGIYDRDKKDTSIKNIVDITGNVVDIAAAFIN